MFGNKTLDRLDQMLSEALSGTFQEEIYDETKLSKLETKWKRFLAASLLSKENLTREKENVKSLVSDISHQTKTPMTNIKLYVDLLEETLQSDQTMERKEETLGNVLDNAIKYSKPESVITISVTEYEMYLAISVKDQGSGSHCRCSCGRIVKK